MKPRFTIEDGVPGVRLATKADEGQLFLLLNLMHQEMGWFTLSPEKVMTGIRLATDRQGGIIYVVEHEGRIVASLGMVLATDWYSDDEYLHERWSFVHPEYRRSDYARRLLEAAKWTHAKFKEMGRNIPVLIGVNSLERTHAKIRLYARHVPCVGACFAYGDFPRDKVNERLHVEMQAIEHLNKQISRHKVPRDQVRPVPETIIRMTG